MNLFLIKFLPVLFNEIHILMISRTDLIMAKKKKEKQLWRSIMDVLLVLRAIWNNHKYLTF